MAGGVFLKVRKDPLSGGVYLGLFYLLFVVVVFWGESLLVLE